MTIWIRRAFSLILFCVLLFALLPFCASADEPEEPEIPHFDLPCTLSSVKVGLYSGSESLYEATLTNYGAYAFDIGYYDFSRQFRKICTVNLGSITLKADSAWHLLYNDNYDSYASAASAAEAAGGFPVYADGKFKVAVGSFESESQAAAAAGSASEPFSGDVLILSSGTPLFLFKSDRIKPAVLPQSADSTAQSQLGDYIYRGGYEFVASEDGRLKVVNFVGLEDYVKGVLPYEVGGDWPSESLMAQAVCARTYAINCINSYVDDGFDVRSDTYSQVYRGVSGTTESTDVATDNTNGKFVRYEGAICRVYYMSSSGGATESGANVFGERREYLSGVVDPYETSVDYYNKTWKETRSGAYLLSRLKSNGYELPDIADITPTYSETGNVIALTFTASNGETATVRLTDCYMVPVLNSMRYSVSRSQGGNGYFEFSGEGWGHNCGMSQWGAYSMAKNYGFNSDQIIDFYFSGAYIG